MSEAGKEKAERKTFSERCKESFLNHLPFWILLFSFIPAMFWFGIFSNGTVLRWWQSLKPYLPEKFYYVREEFIALNSHNNEFGPRIGLYLIIIAAVILWFLRRRKKVKGKVYPLVIIALALFLSNGSRCLCIGKERSGRRRCKWNMTYFYEECQKNPEWKKRFPEKLPELEPFYELDWKWNYPGAGKENTGKRFPVLEDPPGVHAGAARHRLWSDGTVEVYYSYHNQ